MPDNGPSETERGYISEQIVYGATFRYDETGQIVNEPPGGVSSGPFTKLWIRWNKAGETWRRVLSISAGNRVHIDVEGKKYKINFDAGKFKRTPVKESGLIAELRIKDDVNNDGEKSVTDAFPQGDVDEDQIFIITHDSPGCRYKLNQATGQWERNCT